MQTSSPPVITPNRSQSNPDDMITLPLPIQSVGMDLHDVSGTSTGQTLPRERRAPPGTHFCPTIRWVYPHSAPIFILHPLCPLFHPLLSEIYPLLTTLRPSKGGLKRQSLLQTWCGSAHRRGPSANGYDAWRLDPADPGTRSLQLLLQTWCGSAPRRSHPQMVTTPGVLDPADPGARSLQLLLQTWCGSAPRRGPSANGYYDAWRFGSCGPGRKILAAAAADLVWVCAPPRTIRKWLLRRLAFWILRTRAQDPCSCCCRPGVGLRPAVDHPQMVTTPGVLDPADPRARSLQLLLDISDKSG